MKLSRLYQPRHPLFWILIFLNALSSAISYILRSYDLAPPLTAILAVFAVVNVILGIRIALRLMR